MAKVVLKFETNDANGKKLEIDDGSIVSLNSLSQSSSDGSDINYGCIANTGSMTIVDFNGNIAKQIKEGTMPSSNVDVDLYVNNNKIQSHITTDSTYDENTNEFNVSVTNRIADWDILKYKGYVYQNKSATLYEILADVFSVVSDSLDDALSETIIYTYPEDGSYISKQGTIKDYLQLISVEYPSIEYGYTIRQIVDDICTIAQLQCFIDDNDKIKFISARPILNEENIPMIVDKSIILGDIDSDLFIRNKYDWVEFSEQNVSDLIAYSDVVYSSDNDTTMVSQSISSNELNSGYKDFSWSIGVGTVGSVVPVVASYVKIKPYYYNGVQLIVPKKSVNNLEQILEVSNRIFNSEGDPRYSVFCKKVSKDATGIANCSSKTISTFSFSDFSESDFVNIDPISYYERELTHTDTYTYLIDTVSATALTSIPDNSYIKVSDDNDYYYIDYYVLVGWDEVVLSGGARAGAMLTPTNLPISGTVTRFKPNKVSISIYGNKRIISFNEVSANSENIDSAKTKASLSLSSKILQTQTTINGTKMSDIIKHNILSDYKNGLQSAKLKVVCDNMYDESENIVKNWQLGKILENNDVVKLNNKIIKINSRNFIYDGSPEIELQVLEQLYKSMFGLVYNKELIYSWDVLKEKGAIIFNEATKTIEDYNSEVLTVDDPNYTAWHSKLTMPSTVLNIGNDAFRNARLYGGIELSKNLKTVGDYAFMGAILSDSSLILSESITEIGNQAFAEIRVDEVFINCKLTEYNLAIFNSSYISKITIGENITKIGEAWFIFSKLSNIVISNSVTEIDKSAFSSSSIKHIFIPKSVINMASGIFGGCENLTIYCESQSAGSGWHSDWNLYDRNNMLYCPVKYGYTREQYEAEVGLS